MYKVRTQTNGKEKLAEVGHVVVFWPFHKLGRYVIVRIIEKPDPLGEMSFSSHYLQCAGILVDQNGI